MAYLGEGEWFNPISGLFETVNGVWCECYECKRESSCNWAGPEKDVFYTKKEYDEHLQERRRAYFDRQRDKATKNGMARTKEKTEAELVWEGQPVPTFFDTYGDWVTPGNPNDRYLHSLLLRRLSRRGA